MWYYHSGSRWRRVLWPDDCSAFARCEFAIGLLAISLSSAKSFTPLICQLNATEMLVLIVLIGSSTFGKRTSLIEKDSLKSREVSWSSMIERLLSLPPSSTERNRKGSSLRTKLAANLAGSAEAKPARTFYWHGLTRRRRSNSNRSKLKLIWASVNFLHTLIVEPFTVSIR